MNVILISQSTEEPLSVEECAKNMRVDEDDNSPASYFEADEIAKAIRDARTHCEKVLEMSLIQKTLEVRCASWYRPHCHWIELPFGPVRNIVSVKYLDSNGADQTLAANQYRTTMMGLDTVLLPAYGVAWPASRCDHDSIRVQYEVGYPSDDSPPQEVPGNILRAMKLLVTHFYENRGAVDDSRLAELPLGVESLLQLDWQGLGV